MTLYPRQKEYLKLFHAHENILAYGGSRGGKTYVEIAAIISRALRFAGSRHIVARRFSVDVRRSIFEETLPKVLSDFDLHPGTDYTVNVVDMRITFPNGSIVRSDGLDDQARVDKILGTEYATIFVNECQDVPWLTIDKLMTRLSQPGPWSRKFMADLNPGSSNHWAFKMFFDFVNPGDGSKHRNPEQYGRFKINPSDNQGLPEDYIRDRLGSLTGNARRRFLDGDFQTTSELAVFAPVLFFDEKEFQSWGKDRWQDVLIVGGLDLGFSDADAFTIFAYRNDSPIVWQLYEYKARGNSVSDLAKALKEGMEAMKARLPQSFYRVTTPQMALEQRTNTPDGHAPIKRELMFHTDTGGGGRKSASELANVHGLPIVPAYKRDKQMGIELLIDEISSGNFRMIEGGIFHDECSKIVWTRSPEGPVIRELDDKSYHPDMMDAVLYPFRFLWSYVQSLKKS
jgi:PBSX family phage terminase large subunit